MFTKDQAKTILEEALKNGADYAEIFAEITYENTLVAHNENIHSANYSITSGVGLRLMHEDNEVYGSLSGIDYNKTLMLAKTLSKTFNGNCLTVKKFIPEKDFSNPNVKKINDVAGLSKQKLLLDLSQKIKNYDSKIVTGKVTLKQSESNILICNSNGIYQHDFRPYIRLIISANAKEDNTLESNTHIYSAQKGYEFIEGLTFEDDIKETCDIAIQLLKAPKVKPGKMTVVLENGFGGVIFHEACGHPLEASAIARGLSPFCGKVGQKIASDCVTAYDDGTINNAWGKINIDDEGNFPTKNLLIKNGVLQGYMIDRKNSIKMKSTPTGCGRRESYKYRPTSRMTSTYIAPGKNKREDLFKDIKFGLYAKALSGGQVSPANGEFNFGTQSAYYIRDGKICELVKGAMLIGYGHEILKQIDMVADNLALGEGMCGAASGSIPVDVGQPTIRIKNLLVGGGKVDA